MWIQFGTQIVYHGGRKLKTPTMEDKPTFLRKREWEYIVALIETDGKRDAAARKLGVKRHAIENMLSHIRKKTKSAYTFNRKYRAVIARRR